MMNRPHTQQGIGLIEAMIALALLMMTALAMGQLQTSSLVSAQGSSMHFSIDHLSSEMLATLRAHASEAEAGLFQLEDPYDTTSATTTVSTGAASATATVSTEVSTWNSRVAEAIPTGVGGISCSDGFCDVSISWIEEIDGSDYRQFFRTRTPL